MYIETLARKMPNFASVFVDSGHLFMCAIRISDFILLSMFQLLWERMCVRVHLPLNIAIGHKFASGCNKNGKTNKMRRK